MSFSTTFQLEKPDYKTLRYDIPLNSNFDILDSGLKCWPSATQPGDAGNYDSIVLTEGVLWRDTTNHLLKVRGAAAWESILSCATITTVNASGATDLTTWADLIDAGDGADPKYAIAVIVGTVTYYIPVFTAI